MRSKRNLLKVFITAAVTLLSTAYEPSRAGAAELLLRWADNSNDEQGFKIERKLGTNGTFAQIASVGPDITAYTDSGLNAGSTYCYRLQAFNGYGSSPYSETACGSISSTFTLAITKTGTGSGTVTTAPAGIDCGSACSASYNSGTLVTLTATPGAGSTFGGWTGSGCSSGTVTMNGSISCAATFTLQPVQTYTLSVAKAGSGTGTVTSVPAGINCGSTCSASFNSGTLVTLTATPAAASTFSGWSGTGCSNGTVTLNGSSTCTATFTLQPVQTHTLSLAKAGSGTGTVTSTPAGINCGSTCSASFTSGALVTLTAAPAAGSTFSGWSGTGCDNGAFTINASLTCTATFKASSNPLMSKIGIFRPETGEWFLDRSGNWQWDGCDVDACLNSYGYPGDLPVVASWNPDGFSNVGVFDSASGAWQLDTNGNGIWEGCAVDSCISSFGEPGDLPLTRRVNGLSQAMIGTFTPELTFKVKRRTVTQRGFWQFDFNRNQKLDDCSIDQCNQSFGADGDIPVIGDWNATGTEEIGVFQPGTGQWLLDTNGNGKWEGCRKDRCLGPFGSPEDLPVVGDWDGTENIRIGIFRPSTGRWLLDMNGNGKWDGCAVDACIDSFGQPGDLPVTGRW